MVRREIDFSPGPVLKADLTTKRTSTNPGLLAVHKSFGDAKGFILTHIPTMRCVLWSRLKRDCVAAQKELESLDWDDTGTIHATIREIRQRLAP